MNCPICNKKMTDQGVSYNYRCESGNHIFEDYNDRYAIFIYELMIVGQKLKRNTIVRFFKLEKNNINNINKSLYTHPSYIEPENILEFIKKLDNIKAFL